MYRSPRSNAVPVAASSRKPSVKKLTEEVSGLHVEEGPEIPKLLRDGDHSTDIVFTVKGKKLHFSSALLIVCSPVFKDMLTPEFLVSHLDGIALPGKTFQSMASFLQQLHPVYAVTPITDEILLDLLSLADEYKVEHIRTKCEQYIGTQAQIHTNSHCEFLSSDQLLLYLTASDLHGLMQHRDALVRYGALRPVSKFTGSQLYPSAPPSALRDVFRKRCEEMERTSENQNRTIGSCKAETERQREKIATQQAQIERHESFFRGLSCLDTRKLY